MEVMLTAGSWKTEVTPVFMDLLGEERIGCSVCSWSKDSLSTSHCNTCPSREGVLYSGGECLLNALGRAFVKSLWTRNHVLSPTTKLPWPLPDFHLLGFLQKPWIPGGDVRWHSSPRSLSRPPSKCCHVLSCGHSVTSENLAKHSHFK